MRVRVNGAQWELAAGSTLADVVEEMDVPDSGVAVAVDGAVVRRADWAATRLSDGASIEVLTAVQGG